MQCCPAMWPLLRLLRLFLLLPALLAPLAVASHETHDATVSYRGYRLISANVSDAEQIKLLRTLEAQHEVDFFSHAAPGREVRFAVAAAHFEPVLKELQQVKLDYKVLVDDLQEVIDREKTQQNAARGGISRSLSGNGTVTFSSYMRYNEINDYLTRLAAHFPKLVKVASIGKSAKGRDINVIRISESEGKSDRAVLVDAGIHAREWIAPATALYIIRELVENSAANSDSLKNLDWYIIPLLNPDGYEYSHTTDRLWRKNRNGSTRKRCIGTDLNRNFGFHWDPAVGGSRNPCSLIYAGLRPFSEPESISLRDFVLRKNSDGRFKMYLTLHSYGSLILYPWGWTTTLPSDAAELDSIAQEANAAMVAAGASSFGIGSSTNVLYAAAGGSDDWSKGVGNIQKSYTIELPMGGRHGFDLPPDEILQTVTTIFPGIKAFGERAKGLN